MGKTTLKKLDDATDETNTTTQKFAKPHKKKSFKGLKGIICHVSQQAQVNK